MAEIVDERMRQDYLADQNHPVLVSFPRTGSHWVRLLVEEATGSPTLPRPLVASGTDYVLTHHHDPGLRLKHRTVVYLYRRDVSATVFSLLALTHGRVVDTSRMDKYAREYAMHMRRWLLSGPIARRKMVMVYEKLAHHTARWLRRLLRFLGRKVPPGAVDAAVLAATKERMRGISLEWSTGVVHVGEHYDADRVAFEEEHGGHVRRTFLSVDARLARFVC